MTTSQGLRQWLLTEEPTSRRQARFAAWYKGWLTFRSNTLAMLGLMVLAILILAAIFAPLLATQDPFAQDLGQRLLAPGEAPISSAPTASDGTSTRACSMARGSRFISWRWWSWWRRWSG